jgi:pimeloyl-ACP methyl ester carboxylesterase
VFREIAGHRFMTLDIGAGPRTFFAHSGWIGTIEDWLPTLAVLSKSWRAATYDHRGAGETVVPVEEITSEALVDDVFRVMDALAIERCVLGGFSAGTAVVLRALARHPERFEGLVLANGAGGVRPPSAGPPTPPVKPSAWPGADHAARMRWFIERCTPEPDVEHVRRWGHDMLMRAEPGAADRLMGLYPPPEPSLIERVAALPIPKLILHGELDALTSTAAVEHLTSLLPGSKLVVFEGSGHLPLMIRPNETAAAIDAHFGGTASA